MVNHDKNQFDMYNFKQYLTYTTFVYVVINIFLFGHRHYLMYNTQIYIKICFINKKYFT